MKKTNILNLLKTVHPEQAGILKDLKDQIGKNPNIAWYPSARLDFRDLMEVYRTDTIPDLFVHTDLGMGFDLQPGRLLNEYETDLNYQRAEVYIQNITSLSLKNNRIINDENDYYRDIDPNRNIEIFLLDIRIVPNAPEDSGLPEIIQKPCILFFMDNSQFLFRVLLRKNIKISHFIKVREGLMYGYESIIWIYKYFGHLQAKYILVDDRYDNQIDWNRIEHITHYLGIEPVKYELVYDAQQMVFRDWSGYRVKIFELSIIPEECLNEQDFQEILGTIQI